MDTTEKVGQTTVGDGVQTIDVETANGYAPNVIMATAGIPLEITFQQASGCMQYVMFEQFRLIEDLSAGPKTIRLPALEPGEYTFSCGMKMVFGKVVVE